MPAPIAEGLNGLCEEDNLTKRELRRALLVLSISGRIVVQALIQQRIWILLLPSLSGLLDRTWTDRFDTDF